MYTSCTDIHFPDTQYIIEELSSQAIPTNGSLQLSCTAPIATEIAWGRGQPEGGFVPVTSSGDPRVTANGGSLEVTPFHAIEHIGLYYCLATLETGDKVRSCPSNISHASKQNTYCTFYHSSNTRVCI